MVSLSSCGQRVVDWIENTEVSYLKFFKVCIVLFLFIFILVPISIFTGTICLRMPRIYFLFFIFCYLAPLLILVSNIILLFFSLLFPSHFKMINFKIFTGAWNILVLYILFSVSILFFSNNDTHFLPFSTKSKLIDNQVRLPLSSPTGLAIDKEGYLYVALSTYGRIQKYSIDGKFTKGWFVNTAGAYFDIWIDENNFLHAIIARGGGHEIFDLNGNLMSDNNVSSDESMQLFNIAEEYKAKLADKGVLEFKSKGWVPEIILSKSFANKEQSIVRDSFRLQILQTRQICIWVGIALLIAILSYFIKAWGA